VENGLCWRCETPVVKRDLEQWLFPHHKYADELMEHKDIDWPERIQTMQSNWVGKSYGHEISFGLEQHGVDEKEIKVFTTRPDTVFGVTFMVLAPEHPLVQKLLPLIKKAESMAYERSPAAIPISSDCPPEKERTVFLPALMSTNRLTGDRVPVWIADYVLASYGTGAGNGRACASTERDFASPKNIIYRSRSSSPVRNGKAANWTAYCRRRMMINSKQFDGMKQPRRYQSGDRISWKQNTGGKGTISYRCAIG